MRRGVIDDSVADPATLLEFATSSPCIEPLIDDSHELERRIFELYAEHLGIGVFCDHRTHASWARLISKDNPARRADRKVDRACDEKLGSVYRKIDRHHVDLVLFDATDSSLDRPVKRALKLDIGSREDATFKVHCHAYRQARRGLEDFRRNLARAHCLNRRSMV